MPNKVSHCGPNPNDKMSLYCIIVEGKVDCHKHEPLALKLSIRFKTTDSFTHSLRMCQQYKERWKTMEKN